MDFFSNAELLVSQLEEATDSGKKRKKVVRMMMAAAVIAIAQTLMFFPSLGFVSSQHLSKDLSRADDEDFDELDTAIHALMHSMTRAMGKVVEELGDADDEDESEASDDDELCELDEKAFD